MICIYDKFTPQDGFNNLGLRILNPLSAYIHEELNGKYSYEITCPMIPEDDAWTFLQPFNIIKSTTGQLFQINKVVTSTSGGVPTITAYANHIWYYLADMCVIRAEDTREAYWAMRHIFNELPHPHDGSPWDFSGDAATLFSHGDNLVDYNFSWSVQLDGMHHYNFQCVPLAYAILGSPDSIVNQWHGFIHRDNFRFSINKDRKEGASDDAFELIYGYNCTDVKCTYDFSNNITEHWALNSRDIFKYIGESYVPGGVFPHQVITAAKYTIEESNPDQEARDLENMLDSYWAENFGPSSTYEVSFVDPKGTEFENGEWGILKGLKVGDRGYVTSLDGRRESQEIISVKFNDITGRNESLKLGKFIRSDLHEDHLDKIMTDDDSDARRLDVVEKRMDYFELIKGGQ